MVTRINDTVIFNANDPYISEHSALKYIYIYIDISYDIDRVFGIITMVRSKYYRIRRCIEYHTPLSAQGGVMPRGV